MKQEPSQLKPPDASERLSRMDGITNPRSRASCQSDDHGVTAQLHEQTTTTPCCCGPEIHSRIPVALLGELGLPCRGPTAGR